MKEKLGAKEKLLKSELEDTVVKQEHLLASQLS